MHRFETSLIRLFLSTLLLAAGPLVADEVDKAGSEFQVNTYTTSFQGYPRVAVGPNGDFLVVWEGVGIPDGVGVYRKLYSAGGGAVGAEELVNTTTSGPQTTPSVAADGAGNFVVTWDNLSQDGDGWGVFAALVDSSGNAVGSEFQVNTYTTNHQFYSSVAASDDGSFLVVWESRLQDFSLGGIYGQLFDSIGNKLGAEFRVNTTTGGEQNDARVAATPDGFVVTWESDQLDGNNEGVAMQMLNAAAAFVGGETVVNTFTTGDQEDPTVAVQPDGTFAITWEDGAQEGSGNAVYGQVFDSNGSPLGIEFRLNTYTPHDQEKPRVASDGLGGFVAVWESAYQVEGTPDEDIFAQRFDTAGQFLGSEFQVNTQASYDQEYPEIASGLPGRFVVVWHSYPDLDGDYVGVFGQRLAVNPVFTDGFETGNTSAWSNKVP